MKVAWKNMLVPTGFLCILALCLLTGKSDSPLRFAFYPLVVLAAIFSDALVLLHSGISFTALFILLALWSRRYAALPQLVIEAPALLLTSLAAWATARRMGLERERSENAVATFHSLSTDLKHRSMNLQTTLDALSVAHDRLKKLDRDKSRFLANVSHELRAPLSSIRSYSEILLNYNDIDAETCQEFVKVINAESERMTRLINENLDLLRIESGQVEFNIRPAEVGQLISDSIQIVAPIAAEKGLPVVTDIEPGLPAIRADASQLTQVYVNLLSNALKFTTEGKVIIGARLQEHDVEFFVSDTGEGIFPEEQEVIFEEYFRIAENTCNRPRGSGLGLSISKKIVECHGGRIWVESEPGKGSTFRFSIPVATMERPTPTEEGRSVIEETSPEYGPILIMMESSPVRYALRKKLEEIGFRTLGAGSPDQALKLAEGMKPDVIIAESTDRWQEFIRLEQWTHTAGIEMILSTLHLSPSNGTLNLAACGYLCKPFDPFTIKSSLKPGTALVIVSPYKDEARNLQVMLGTEWRTTKLFSDEQEAVKACRNERPDGIVIGSYSRTATENLISMLKQDSRTADIALYLVLASNISRHVRTVTVENGPRRGGAEGIYPLLKEVEKAYLRKWGKE